MEAERRTVIRPDEGYSISLGGLGVVHKLSEQDAAGSFSVRSLPLLPQLKGVTAS